MIRSKVIRDGIIRIIEHVRWTKGNEPAIRTNLRVIGKKEEITRVKQRRYDLPIASVTIEDRQLWTECIMIDSENEEGEHRVRSSSKTIYIELFDDLIEIAVKCKHSIDIVANNDAVDEIKKLYLKDRENFRVKGQIKRKPALLS